MFLLLFHCLYGACMVPVEAVISNLATGQLSASCVTVQGGEDLPCSNTGTWLFNRKWEEEPIV